MKDPARETSLRASGKRVLTDYAIKTEGRASLCGSEYDSEDERLVLVRTGRAA